MAGRDNSFTVNIIPHDANRRRRQWIITGRKLLTFRIVVLLLAIVVAGSAVILIFGADELSRNAELRARNEELQDSLRISRELNRRLDLIEEELQQIRETRLVIENLATEGASTGASE